MKTGILTLTVLAALSFAACGPETPEPAPAPEPPRLPAACMGTWELTGTSGGMTGDGVEVLKGIILVLFTDRTAERRVPGKPPARAPFTARRGPTIFSAEPGWHIESAQLGLSGVIEVSGDGKHLTISDNHPDGFNHHYRRVK